MPIVSVAAMAMMEGEGLSGRDVHWMMIFAGVIAVSLVVQAVGVVISGVFAAKLLHRVDGIAVKVDRQTVPILARTHQLLEEIAPKIHGVSENVEQISYTVRARVEEMGATVGELNRTVQEFNGRTRAQVARVDGIVSGALGMTEEIAETVQESIKMPIRQMAGVLAGLKAGLETLVARSPFGR